MSKRRAAFLTLGCKVNQYETDAMEEILEKAGRLSVLKRQRMSIL